MKIDKRHRYALLAVERHMTDEQRSGSSATGADGTSGWRSVSLTGQLGPVLRQVLVLFFLFHIFIPKWQKAAMRRHLSKAYSFGGLLGVVVMLVLDALLWVITGFLQIQLFWFSGALLLVIGSLILPFVSVSYELGYLVFSIAAGLAMPIHIVAYALGLYTSVTKGSTESSETPGGTVSLDGERKYEDDDAERAHRRAQNRDPSEVVQKGERVTLVPFEVDHGGRRSEATGKVQGLIVLVDKNLPSGLNTGDPICVRVYAYGSNRNSAKAMFESRGSC